MKITKQQTTLSATDLSNHIACKHATQLERQYAARAIEKPVRKNHFLDRIIERGIDHEAAYLRHLREASNLRIVEFTREESRVEGKTLSAMKAGADVIYQGALSTAPNGRSGNETVVETGAKWAGRPDFLIRVQSDSPAFGAWSYEAVDTKLTQNTKAGTIMQLCVYSDLLTQVQGIAPVHMHVVMPYDDATTPYESEAHKFNNYDAYYRRTKADLVDTIAKDLNPESYPEPVSHCDICQWWPDCDKRRRSDDHLTFVASIQKTQIKALATHNITTLTALAEADSTVLCNQLHGSPEPTDRVCNQARIQLKGRTSGKPEFEFLPIVYPEEGNNQRRGFLKLPAPDPNGDLFFDIESARHAPGGGLEYLLGYATVTGGETEPDFDYLWAIDRPAEKAAFEQFIDLAMERLSEYPNMHIYHFAPYEPAALKRLATRHATREAELDTLLRKQCFVDLYTVTRQAIRASVESYSIKCLEQFYGYHREEELAEARLSMHRLESLLEIGAGSKIRDEDKAVVLKYNRDDCVSTLALRNWLEALRDQQIANGVELPRPPAPEEYTSKEEERAPQVQEVFDALTASFVDTSISEWTDQQQSRWLLANSLDYFRREEKNAWWEYHRLRELDTTELLKERNAITGLTFLSEVAPEGRSKIPSHVYSYPDQFVTMDKGADIYEASTEDGAPVEFKIGTIVSIDHNARTIEIKKTGNSINKHPTAIFHHRQVKPEPMQEALLDFGKQVAANAAEGIRSAEFDLLTRQEPRFTGTLNMAALRQHSADSVEQTCQLISNLDHSVLAVQGPPGTGKTYTGSHVIAKLLQSGKRVGITAVSHAVIANLLSEVLEADSNASIAHKGDKYQVTNNQCDRLKHKNEIMNAIADGKVVGATAFTWAAPEMAQQLDYLFIDEAGQMSLAMALTAARAARNVILLGDPQQLEQPQRAAHPEGSDVAALAHLIGEHQTIRAEQGLFLDTTYRMHPKICDFTSSQYYDGRLKAQPSLSRQIITGPSLNRSQLIYRAVDHYGNQSRSEEEAKAIQSMIKTLLAQPHQWTDSEGNKTPIQPCDILVIAPYNAQVALLKQLLPEDIRVGTVDKFQGQQAPVVFYSMTSSSVEDAPRGMSFLFSPNRFNVATSRAKCTVVVVGSTALINADCSTPEQIQWVNGLCRFVEMAQSTTLAEAQPIQSKTQRESHQTLLTSLWISRARVYSVEVRQGLARSICIRSIGFAETASPSL